MTLGLNQIPALSREIARIFGADIARAIATALFVGVFCAWAGVVA